MVTLSIDSFRMRKGGGLVEEQKDDAKRVFSNQVTVFHQGFDPEMGLLRAFFHFFQCTTLRQLYLTSLQLTRSIPLRKKVQIIYT